MLDFDRVSMLGEHVGETPISHGAFIQIGADKHDAASSEPIIHFGALKSAFCFLAAKSATGPMDGGIEHGGTFRWFDTFDNHSVVAHAAADKAALAGESRRRALADDPIGLAGVLLTPSEIVMIVHAIEDGSADYLADAFDDPLPADISV